MSLADNELDPLEALKMEYAGRFAMIADLRRADMVVDDIENLFAAILAWHQRKLEAEVAKARIDELEWAKRHSGRGMISVEFSDRLAQLKGDNHE